MPKDCGFAASKLDKTEGFAPVSASWRTRLLCWLPNSCCQYRCLTISISRMYLQEARESWNLIQRWGVRTYAKLPAFEMLLWVNMALTPISITSSKITARITNMEWRIHNTLETTQKRPVAAGLCMCGGAMQLPKCGLPPLHTTRSPCWAGKTHCLPHWRKEMAKSTQPEQRCTTGHLLTS